ncbi:MAG: UbiA family prenyltransferase [Acidilobaceae archaeon]|nr:UbiA family prenyltransferase [Acidilobaceae archaeon]MCX8165975.1 UbiA family prenyltransferase [Acidilobaceae archaeon]MDW7974618.1 UbiA family prenyltransferase [Sulfolobales archaeon]
MLNTIKGLLELGRVPNAIAGTLAIFLGASVISGSPPTMFSPYEFIAISLIAMLVSFSVMTVNDIMDLEADRVNAPWRPLPSGRVSVRAAWAASIFYVLASLLLSLTLEPVPLFFLLTLSFLVAANLYNVGGKRAFLLGNLLVALLTSFPIAVGAVLAALRLEDYRQDLLARALLYTLMAFLSVLAREIAKGIPDVEGDRKAGVRTIANVYGEGFAATLAALLYGLSIAVSFLPPLLDLVDAVAYLAIVLPVNLMVALEAARLMRRPTKEVALSHKKRILGLMVLSMIGLYLGAAYHEPYKPQR